MAERSVGPDSRPDGRESGRVVDADGLVPATPDSERPGRSDWGAGRCRDYSAVNFSTARQASGNSPAARATLSRSPTRNGVTPSEIAVGQRHADRHSQPGGADGVDDDVAQHHQAGGARCGPGRAPLGQPSDQGRSGDEAQDVAEADGQGAGLEGARTLSEPRHAGEAGNRVEAHRGDAAPHAQGRPR